MIGIMCSINNEKKLAERFYDILKKMNANSAITMFFFTASNLHVEDMTAAGILISGEEFNMVNLKLSHIIVNLSIQTNKADTKKLRRLQEIDDIELINEVNRFNQFMIMDMLISIKSTRKYLIPYEEDSLTNCRYNDFKSCILIPQRGSKISKIIFIKSQDNSFKIKWGKKIQWCSGESINNYINYIKNNRKYIVLKSINLADEKLVVRVYVQKISQETWRCVGKRIFANEIKSSNIEANIDDIAILIIKQINYFIPRLGSCFIDFIIDGNRKPYFIHLGGFDKYILFNDDDHQLSNDFVINLINYIHAIYKDWGKDNVG